MQKAKEIMSSPPISINEDQTLQETIELLAEHRFSGLPVVDSEGKIAGIISETDIVRYSHQATVVPMFSFSGWISPHADISELASIRKGLDLLHRTRVGEIMTKKVQTVTEDRPVTDIARLMNRHNINRIPVVDKNSKLVGIVTRADIVQCMSKL